MGSGAVFFIRFGQRDEEGLKESICASFVLIAVLTLLLNLLAFGCLNGICIFLQVPKEVWEMMRSYLLVIFSGITATFLYNYFASLLRAVGVLGAAGAMVVSQYISGIGIAFSTFIAQNYGARKKERIQAGMSVVLTVISLGTRVTLAYILSAMPAVGVGGIWWSIPIGWFLADTVGIGYYIGYQKKLLGEKCGIEIPAEE